MNHLPSSPYDYTALTLSKFPVPYFFHTLQEPGPSTLEVGLNNDKRMSMGVRWFVALICFNLDKGTIRALE